MANLISTDFSGGVFEKLGTSTVVETGATTPQVGPDSLDDSTPGAADPTGEYNTNSNAVYQLASTYTTAGKTVIVWREGTANYPPPRAVVATVTGDAIMYGTNVATSGSYDCEDGLSIAYDQANDKVLVVHSTNNNHGTYGVVGTITGDAIAFGTVYDIDSGSTPNDNSTRPQGMVWVGGIGSDTTNRLVLAYKHNSNNDGESRVITISGTTPTKHAVADWASAPGDFCMAYVGNAQVVIAYAEGTALKAKVGTIAGGGTNTITWGSVVDLDSSTNAGYGQLAIAYDEQNSKVVIVFVDTATNTRGRYIAATVSGTGASGTITFSGKPEFETAGGITVLSAAYHTGAQKILISFYGAPASSSYIKVLGATYSSTVGSAVTYTFGTENQMMSAKSGLYALTSSYDTLNKKVIAFREGGNGYKHGLAVDLLTTTVTLDLTTGSYFTADLQGGTSRIDTITAIPGAVAPKMLTFNLKVTQGSFPKYFKWSGSALAKFKWQKYWLPGTGWVHRPTISTTNDVVDVYSFTTYDNGVTWYSSIVGQNIS